jgi:succinate dehydrogenase/fumarate reductase cytochrome b subunit
MTLRKLHAMSAILVAAFLCLHITNHLAGLAGVATHIAFMESARSVYRFYPVELTLLVVIGFQMASGLTLAVRGWKDRRGLVPWLQALSGLYLVLFLLIHVGAIMYGRGILGLDTNFRYAAAGFHVPPWQWFFAPYYFLAVVSLFTHIGCAVYWNIGVSSPIARLNSLSAFAAFGVLAGLMIDLSLAGKLYPVDIPAAYRAVYRSGTN